MDAVLRAGDIPPTGEVEQLCEERPLDERVRALLMRTLYRDGRQADALRSFRDIRHRLVEELGVEPSKALVRLNEQILLQDTSLDPVGERAPGHLPTFLTSFVGRRDDGEHLKTLLGEHRLVTLTGPGGVGKTRLAVEVAAMLRQRFGDGVWLVDLATVTAPDAVAPAVAATLHVPFDDPAQAVDQIAAVLDSCEALIVLDNCEHLHDAVAGIATHLLRATVGVTILATSRVPLRVNGESRYALAGLEVSADGGPGDAERLFLERAAAVADRTADRATHGDEDAVRSLCRQLDGIPLALELAAARRDVLSTEEITDLLVRRFAVLVDHHQPRDLHRSLEATVGWSWGLLDPVERRAFAELGVFDGPFTLDAATDVFAGVDDTVEVLALLERLVAASLVVRVAGAPTRYRLLETLRAYAHDRLDDAGDRAGVEQRHDDHYVARCRSLADEFFGRGRVAATEAIGAELADHLSTWRRRIEREPVRVLPLAWPLGNYWMFEGRLGEGEAELRRVLDATSSDTSVARADALIIAGWIETFRNRMDVAIGWTDEALGTYRASGDQRRIAFGLARAGHWAFASGDGGRGVSLLQESLALCDEIGFDDGKAWPTVLLAQARRWSGDESAEVREMLLDARRRFVETAETYGQIHADMLLGSCQEFPPQERLRFGEEMVELSARPGGENLMRPIAFHNVAYPLHHLGETERAIEFNRAAVRSSLATGATMDLGLALIQAATFAAVDGPPDRVVRLAAAGRAHFGMAMAPFQHRLLDPLLADARRRLGDDHFDELERIGSALSAEEAAQLALA